MDEPLGLPCTLQEFNSSSNKNIFMEYIEEINNISLDCTELYKDPLFASNTTFNEILKEYRDRLRTFMSNNTSIMGIAIARIQTE